MSKVTLGQVAMEVRESTKDPTGLPIVGLEHLVPGELQLTQWSESSENTFTKLFHKGQVLFGRRRAYQKKAVVADFDGVCSGDITVIAARPDRLLPDLLPFIVSDDRFFDFAMEKSAGSLSPRVKWAQLAEYTFDLPDDMEEQRRLSTLLWAMERNRVAYQNLLMQMDELVKSQFVEMTQGPNSTPVKMGDIATFINGAAFKPKDWSTTGRPIIRIQNLNDANADYNYFAGEIDDKYLVHHGEVLISWATHLEAYIWNGGEGWLNQHIFRTIFNKMEVDKVFFIYAANVALKEAFKKAHGFKATMEHIKRGDFEDSVVMIPPIEVQRQFGQFADQTDKSKYDSKVNLDNAWIGGDMCA